MAKFNYKVLDPAGQPRSGVMEAHNLADAQRIIRSRGFTVVELEPAKSSLGPPPPLDLPEPELPVQEPSAPTGSGRLGPPPPLDLPEARPTPMPSQPAVLEYRPAAQTSSPNRIGKIEVHQKSSASLHHRGPAPRRGFRPSLLERWSSLLPSAKVSRNLALGLCLGGLVWMAITWKSPDSGTSSPVSKPSSQPGVQAFKLKVAGSVKLKDGGSLGDVQILLDLPEIPYQQTFDWSKLEHPKADGYLLEVKFESPRRAHKVILSARKPGYGSSTLPEQPIRPEGGELLRQDFLIGPSRP